MEFAHEPVKFEEAYYSCKKSGDMLTIDSEHILQQVTEQIRNTLRLFPKSIEKMSRDFWIKGVKGYVPVSIFKYRILITKPPPN